MPEIDVPRLVRHARRLATHAATPLAVLVLHLAYGMYYWMPARGGRALLAPTWELVGLVAVFLAAGARRLPRGVDRVLVPLAAVLSVGLVFLGFAQGFARLEFGYDVALAIDLKYVPVLIGMMYQTNSPARFVASCAVVVLVAFGAVLALALAVRRVHAVAKDPARRRRFGLGFGGVALVAALVAGVQGPLVAVAYEQIDLAVHREEYMTLEARALEREVERQPFRPGPWRPTVLVFVIEAYGAAVFDEKAFADIPELLQEEAGALAAAGYSMRTRYLESPVFGGNSWMAHGTMLCGARIQNQKRYEALKHAHVTCLPRALGDAGWFTVVAGGNTDHVDDAYRRLFPYKKRYFREDLPYAGPSYAWSNMPDQYVIDQVHRGEIAGRPADAPPLFAFYMLTSSHWPWALVPELIEDWEQLGDGRIFHERRGIAFPGNTFEGGTDYMPGYAASMRYTLRTVFAYLRRLPPEQQPLVIIVGDHQPRPPNAFMERDPWWVPVHVLSRDPQAVERFAALGYQPGLMPDPAAGAVPLEHLVGHVLTVLGHPGAAAPPRLEPHAGP
jgi:hypothetical protein